MYYSQNFKVLEEILRLEDATGVIMRVGKIRRRGTQTFPILQPWGDDQDSLRDPLIGGDGYLSHIRDSVARLQG